MDSEDSESLRPSAIWARAKGARTRGEQLTYAGTEVMTSTHSDSVNYAWKQNIDSWSEFTLAQAYRRIDAKSDHGAGHQAVGVRLDLSL